MGNESSRRIAVDQIPDSELDLPGVWKAIVRKKALIGAVTLGAFLAGLAFVMLVKASFTGEVKLIVENQESYFTRPEKAPSEAAPPPDSEAIASQVQLISSRDVAHEAIRQLGLKGNVEFDPLAGGEGIVGRILGLAGLAAPRASLSFEDRLLEAFGKKLTVFALPKSRVITVEFSSRDPELAARGANTIADIYTEYQAKTKRERASVAAASLGAIVADLRAKLAEAETRIETFRSSSGLLAGSGSANIPNQQLGELSAQLASARNAMAEAQAKARLIRGNLQRGRLDEISDIAKDELVRRTSEQRTNLRARLALEARTLGPVHPRMQELNAQLASIERELRVAAERSARALENDARIASSRVDNINAAIESEKRLVGGTGKDQARLRELELEAKLIREQLESNTTKYREALSRQQSQSTPADARIISRAVVPDKASFPKKVPILLFAFLGGFLLSVSGVVAGELLSGGAMRPVARNFASSGENTGADSDSFVGARALEKSGARSDGDMGAPSITANRPLVQAMDPFERLGPEAAKIVTRLAATNTSFYAQRILICTASMEIGAGFTFERVARTLAADRRSVLIDFGGRVLKQSPGVSDLLAGEASFGDIIERDAHSRLHLIGRGRGDIVLGSDLDSVLDALSQTYEFVFILAPQANEDRAFLLAMAPAADSAVIIDADENVSEATQELRETLLQHGVGDVSTMAIAPVQRAANDRVSSTREFAA